MSNFKFRSRTSKASSLRSRADHTHAGTAGAFVEALEQRQLLTAVFWDGGAGTNNWNDAANWNRGGVDALPMNGDDVTIDVAAATPTIAYASGTLALNSLVSNEAISVNGGTLGLGAGGTADINALLTLNGGTLSDGVWDVTGGSITGTSNGNNRLRGVTVNGNIDLAVNNAVIRINNGLTLNGVVTLSGNSANLVFDNTQSLGGAATVLFSGDVTHTLGIDGSSTLTILPGVLVHGSRGSIGSAVFTAGNNALINQGMIIADVANASGLSIAADVTTNTGTVGSTMSGLLTLGGAWSNAGTLLVNDSTLNLAGSFLTAGVGAFNRTAGTVNLTGALDNAAATLNLNASTGSWVVAGGSISGGTVTLSGGSTLVATSNGNNRLSGVTVNGNIDLAVNNAVIRVSSGLTLNGVITLSGNTANLVFDNTQSLGGSGSVVFVGDVTHTLGIDGNSTLTVLAGITIHGARGSIGSAVFTAGNNALINQGMIIADVANASGLSIAADVTTNTGTIGSTMSGLLTLGGSWSNSGTLLVNNSTLNLAGSFTMTGVGAFNRTAGTVNLTGAMTGGAGDVFNLNANTGSWVVAGGSISGGTVTLSGGSILTMTSNGNNRFTGVTVNGNIDLAVNNAVLRVSGGLTLNGLITLSGNSANLVFDNTQSLGGAATILFSGDVTHTLGIDGSSTLTILPGVLVHGARGSIGSAVFTAGNNALINQGMIIADVANGSGLSIAADVTTNTGTIGSTMSGLLTLGGSWSNSGTLLVNNSTLNLAGSFAMTGVGTFSRTAGTVNLTGDMTGGAGDVFNLNADTGSWVVAGGSISGGTVTISGGSNFTVTSNGNNRFTGVTVNGNIELAANNAVLRINNGLTLNGVVTLSGNSANLVFDNTQTLGGAATVLFSGDVTHTLGIDGSSTLTILPGVLVHGARGSIGSAVFTAGNNALINQGMIVADVANGSGLTIAADVTTNAGTIGSTMSGLLTLGGAWSNSGTLLVNNSTLNLAGAFAMNTIGTFKRTAGTVNLTGTVSGGAGDILELNASTGSWVLVGGTIAGGTVNLTGGSTLVITSNGNNRFTGTAINGDVNLAANNAVIRVNNGLTLNGVVTISGNSANLVFDNTQSLGGTGSIVFAGDVVHTLGVDGSSTLTILAGITLRGTRGNIGSAVFTAGNNALINQGTIIADTNNASGLAINADVFTNAGTIVARTSGKLTITPAAGTPVALANTGVIIVGSMGVIRVNGNFVQSGAGVFRAELSGVQQQNVGKLMITGTATLDGTFSTVAVAGFVNTCLNVEVLTAATVDGQFAVNNFVSPPAGFQSIAVYPGGAVRFAITQLSDWTRDGFLNSQDFFDFIGAFFAGTPGADFNSDGFVNSQDFFDFVSSFFLPCP